MNWHLYGILRSAQAPLEWQAVQGIQLQTIVAGSLGAVVSVPLEGQMVQQALLHNSIVEATLEQIPLLPARFATPISAEQIQRQLESQQTALLRRLTTLQFTREYAVRAQLEPLPVVESIPTTSGRAYLEGKAALLRISEARAEQCQQLKATLEAVLPFRESKVLEASQELYRLAFLVAQDKLLVFQNALQSVLASQHQGFVRITMHGAFAPYSFAETDSSQ